MANERPITTGAPWADPFMIEQIKKYDGIPWINKIVIAGHLDDRAIASLRVKNGEKSYRCIVEVPSRIKPGINGSPYVSHLPIYYKKADVDQVYNRYRTKEQPIAIEGEIRGYRKVDGTSLSRVQRAQILDVLEIQDNKSNENMIKNLCRALEKIFEMTNDGQSKTTNQARVDASNIFENPENEVKNIVTLQGLVAYPPDLVNKAGLNTYGVAFKVLTRYKTIGGKDRFDTVRALYLGADAREVYKRIKQGEPVSLKGSMESNKYKKNAVVATTKEKAAIASLLKIPHQIIGNEIVCQPAELKDYIDKIVTILNRAEDSLEVLQTHEVWITSIETDPMKFIY